MFLKDRMIRFFDLVSGLMALLILSPLILSIFLFLKMYQGDAIFRQERLGRYEKPFYLLKFRTMKHDTPQGRTSSIGGNYISTPGKFLRAWKLDELPQLVNIIRGDMGFVGPRPGLVIDQQLRDLRAANSLFTMRPGLTGVAQLMGVDMSTPKKLVRLDRLHFRHSGICACFVLCFKTLCFLFIRK